MGEGTNTRRRRRPKKNIRLAISSLATRTQHESAACRVVWGRTEDGIASVAIAYVGGPCYLGTANFALLREAGEAFLRLLYSFEIGEWLSLLEHLER